MLARQQLASKIGSQIYRRVRGDFDWEIGLDTECSFDTTLNAVKASCDCCWGVGESDRTRLAAGQTTLLFTCDRCLRQKTAVMLGAAQAPSRPATLHLLKPGVRGPYA